MDKSLLLEEKLRIVNFDNIAEEAAKMRAKMDELEAENNLLKQGKSLDSRLKSLQAPEAFHHGIKHFFGYRKERKLFKQEVNRYKESLTLGFWDKRKVDFTHRPESVSIEDRQMKVNDTYKRIYYLSEITATTVLPGIFFKILNCPFPLTISIYVDETSSAAMIRAVKATRSVLESEKIDRQTKGKSRKEEVDLSIEHATDFIEKLVAGQEKAFFLSIYIAIEANSKEELEKFHNQFKNASDESQLSFNTYSFEQDTAYQSLLPLVQNKAMKRKVAQTTLLTYLMPFLQKNSNDPDGIFLGRNISNGSIVLFDLFRARNANVNILGTSGSGKSVTAKLMALRLLLRKVQVVIIDPEGEYQKITKAVNGKVIKFSRKKGINPFYIGTFDEEAYKDHIQILKEFFKFFIAEKNYNQAILDEALVSIYKEKNPNFTNLLKKLLELGSPEMARDIKVLNEGSLSGIFNSEEKLDIQDENLDWLSFDLSDLDSEEYKKPAMFLLASIVSKLIKKADRRRMLFIDEAHILLENRETAIFYKNLVKRARKYNAGVVSISQNIEDYLSSESEFGKSIVTNAETTVLLKQSFASLKSIFASFPINESEKVILPTLAQGEALLFREKEHMRIYIIPLKSEKEFVFT